MPENEKINVSEQVSMILDIANQLRGPFKAEEYEKTIIPTTILRRFECILAATKDKVVEAFKNGTTNETKLKYISGFPIYNTSPFTLEKLKNDAISYAESTAHNINATQIGRLLLMCEEV